MTIYNIISKKSRKIEIFSPKNSEDGLFGLMIRREFYLNAMERVFKILKVINNSPAYAAGLISDKYFLLGLTLYSYNDLNNLNNIFFAQNQKKLEICVFNKVTFEIKYVSIIPNKDWGGKGILGCEIGSGILNQIPSDYNLDQIKVIYDELGDINQNSIKMKVRFQLIIFFL